jgi:hypothetical protein
MTIIPFAAAATLLLFFFTFFSFILKNKNKNKNKAGCLLYIFFIKKSKQSNLRLFFHPCILGF